jgi:hypothetical protein
MSCTCKTSPLCEPCAFCTPPGVTCLTTCVPPDPCPEKINLDCVLYSGETHTCSNITHLDPLSDVLLKILETLFPPSYCCALIGELSSGPSYKLTILSSGPDIGPYNIFYISTTGGITNGSQNVAKSAFTSPGYSINVPIGTQYIRLQSVNPNCSYYDFNI